MRKEYDFSKARPNPYAKRLKRSVTIRIDEATITQFKRLAANTGIPYPASSDTPSGFSFGPGHNLSLRLAAT